MRSVICFIFCCFCISIAWSQELAPKEYYFNWQKANGDQYDIAIKNELSQPVALKRLDRACMQILLKAMLKSRDFESFVPERFILNEDTEYNVARLDFSYLDRNNEKQRRTFFYQFDYFGNVFNQIE